MRSTSSLGLLPSHFRREKPWGQGCNASHFVQDRAVKRICGRLGRVFCRTALWTVLGTLALFDWILRGCAGKMGQDSSPEQSPQQRPILFSTTTARNGQVRQHTLPGSWKWAVKPCFHMISM